ncbi:MAG TPA: hypothetical protein P5528_02530 [Steroidobacteraceae bacterium]|nr:hypothetical protein [Steroidobacteraceae bacterium]HRX88298.1 hypothetical protein [Steroidobacteraceae bacterium]
MQPDVAIAQRNRGRRTLLILAAIFFVPLAISFALYYGELWRPTDSTNKGELISPAVPLPEVMLRNAAGAATGSGALFGGKWSVVHIADGSCDADCRAALVAVRQTRLTLANEMPRVQRILLATGNCCDNNYLSTEQAGLLVVDASDAAGQTLLGAFPAGDQTHALYIVDPLGNLMMRHDARENPKDLQSDLKKLLKLSHVG